MAETPHIDLASLVLAFGTAAFAAGATYAFPELAQFRPWVPGDPIPVFASLIPKETPQVEEDARTGLVTRTEQDTDDTDLPVEEPPVADSPAAPEVQRVEVPRPIVAPRTPSTHGLGFVTQLEDPEHRGMRPYFQALKRTQEGAVVRALHYGDSTIAADGLAKTVRSRLQQRFGNAGPGFVSAGMDPRWNKRADVDTTRSGTFTNKSILLGGANGRYGLGGIVGIGSSGSKATLRVAGGDSAQPLRRAEIWYQAGKNYGELWVRADDGDSELFDARADVTEDRRYILESDTPFTKLSFGADRGAIPWYGVVLETGNPGATWESMGVIGVGSRSFLNFNKDHLREQIAQRSPDLIVLMLGGNEADYPVLLEGDGSGYQEFYLGALGALRAGAPNAGCLMVSPLDQGTRSGGKPRSKPGMKPILANQRKIAEAQGCAYFSAYDAMGGDGSMVDWASRKPPLAWPDLAHVSAQGLDAVGNILADAILADYEHWLAEGGL